MHPRTLANTARALLALGIGAAAGLPAHADEQPAAPAAPETPAAPTSNAMTSPAMTGPLAANPDPFKFDAGPLGPVYITGAVTGLGLVQTNATAADKSDRLDLGNAQAVAQNTTGLVQFYAQVGIYSIPALGTPYVPAARLNNLLFGPLPEGYLKLAPNDSFSIQAGKLPTLIGAEYTFTFENMNIERGLLWAQEPAISDGLQGNYTVGPLAFSVSLNDGYYSGDYNWLTGSIAWTIDTSNTVSVVGGGNFGHSPSTTFATPATLNSGEIFNVIYTYNAAPWTITPYFQFINTPSERTLGWTRDAQSYGGAVLASYAFTDNFNLAGRAEVLTSTGNATDGAPNLILGPGSTAWSLTVTPTYQQNLFFVRAEASYVGASSTSGGLAFGHSGTANNQARFLAETGVVF